jgi:uncharacterized protein YjhX (UPF0386 family)
MPARRYKDAGTLGPASAKVVALLAQGGRILEKREGVFSSVATYRETTIPVPQNVLALLRRKRVVRREGGQGCRLQIVRVFVLDPEWVRTYGHRHGLTPPPSSPPDAP